MLVNHSYSFMAVAWTNDHMVQCLEMLHWQTAPRVSHFSASLIIWHKPELVALLISRSITTPIIIQCVHAMPCIFSISSNHFYIHNYYISTCSDLFNQIPYNNLLRQVACFFLIIRGTLVLSILRTCIRLVTLLSTIKVIYSCTVYMPWLYICIHAQWNLHLRNALTQTISL